MKIEELYTKALAFQDEAHRILSRYESSPSRVVLLEETSKKISGLTIKQGLLLKQGIKCIECNLFRAAHIMAWAAIIDLIEEKLSSDNFVKLNQLRPKWSIQSLDEFRENIIESQIIDACKDLGLFNKSETKMLHGYLTKRNLCAHPSNFDPDYNQTLGYFSDIITMLESILKKKYP